MCFQNRLWCFIKTCNSKWNFDRNPLLIFSGIWFLRWELCIFTYSNPHKIYVPIENFSILETSPLPVKCFKFWLFNNGTVKVLSRKQLLWHGPTLYIHYLRGPQTLTPFAERLAVRLSLSVFTTKVCRGWNSNIQPSTCEANALTDCVTAADVKNNVKLSLTVNFTCLTSLVHVKAMRIFH